MTAELQDADSYHYAGGGGGGAAAAVPPGCTSRTALELDGVNAAFYRYVVPAIAAAGLAANLLFWTLSALRPVPKLSVYERLLVAASAMEALQLAGHLLEALWFISSGYNYAVAAHGSLRGAHVLWQLNAFLKSSALNAAMLTIAWVCVNCHHDVGYYSAGVTGGLIKKLKDHECTQSLSVIVAAGLSLAAAIVVPKGGTVGPFCVYSGDGDTQLIHLLVPHDTAFRFIATVIEAFLPVSFVAFLWGILVSTLWKLRKRLALTPFDPATGGGGRQTLCGQINAGGGGNGNEIRLAVFFLVVPLCVYYILCWTPQTIVNAVNVITKMTTGKTGVIKNDIVVWLFTALKLLTSVLNPLTFTLVTWKYQKGPASSDSGARTRRSTQETNV